MWLNLIWEMALYSYQELWKLIGQKGSLPLNVKSKVNWDIYINK